MMLWGGLAAMITAFVIALVATPFVKRLAARWGFMDIPARHKTHSRPVPLLGGCAILLAVLLPGMLALAFLRIWSINGAPSWLPADFQGYVPKMAAMAPEALWLFAGAVFLHVLGIIDDRKQLSPLVKLLPELAMFTALVFLCPKIRILTVLGPAPSVILTILWLTAMANSFNFLDNMDGLSAGVALICGAALLGASVGGQQYLVTFGLCLTVGALAGFLPYNYAPASIYMGDAGSLVVGYLMGTLSCLTTYVPAATHHYYPYVFIPMVVMAVPLYDMISVITLRLRDRKNPMVGDRNHFSHRLVRRGMNVRTAVGTIYLATAGTSIAASLLPRVDNVGAVLIIGQTLAILLTVALLESGETHP